MTFSPVQCFSKSFKPANGLRISAADLSKIGRLLLGDGMVNMGLQPGTLPGIALTTHTQFDVAQPAQHRRWLPLRLCSTSHKPAELVLRDAGACGGIEADTWESI